MRTLSLTKDRKSSFTTERELYRQRHSIEYITRQGQAGMQTTCSNIARGFAGEHSSVCIFCDTLIYIQVFTQQAQPKPLDKPSPIFLFIAKTLGQLSNTSKSLPHYHLRTPQHHSFPFQFLHLKEYLGLSL